MGIALMGPQNNSAKRSVAFQYLPARVYVSMNENVALNHSRYVPAKVKVRAVGVRRVPTSNRCRVTGYSEVPQQLLHATGVMFCT